MGDRDRLALGLLGRPHGLHGEIALRAFDPDGRGLSAVTLPIEVDLVYLAGQRRETLVVARRSPDGWQVRFRGVDSREAASALTHARLEVARALMPPLHAGEFYVADLIGATVLGMDEQELGVVESLYWNGAQDVMLVRGQGGDELMIPAVPAYLLRFDESAMRVWVEVP